MKRLSALVACIPSILVSSLLTSPTSGASEVLFEVDSAVQRSGGSSGLQTTPTPFSIDVTVYEPGSAQSPLARLFQNIRLDFSDIGTTFIASAETDPQFQDYANLLTDNVVHGASVPANIGPYFSYSNECNHFHGDPTCGAGIGFEGYVLDRVTYTIKDWYLVSPGRDPNNNGFWTDTYFGARFTIEGHAIPEPTSCLLLAACILIRLACHRQVGQLSVFRSRLRNLGQL